MQGFRIINGDISIENREIEITNDVELIAQTVQSVLSTNKGEWFFNEDEGIRFENVLGKNVEENVVKGEIEQGLKQVDATLTLIEFSCTRDKITRKLIVSFKAQYAGGETVEVNGITWD